MNLNTVKMAASTKAFAVTLAAVAGVAFGAGTTFVVLKAKLQEQYDRQLEEELEKSKEFLARRYKAETFGDLSTYEAPEVPVNTSERESVLVNDAVEDLLIKSGYTPYNKFAGEQPPIQREEERIEVMASQRRNAFDNQPIVETAEYDEAAETAKAFENLPYVIRDVEFYENVKGATQYTFQYFEEDDVLVDENQSPIDKAVADRNLGLGNLRFGYGSSHKHTVLIRNPVSGNEYEIIRDPGSYSQEIMGFHASQYEEEDTSPRKFRADD